MAENVPVGVRHGGLWVTLPDGSEKYRGGRVRLISVPKDIKYHELLTMIYDCTQINPTEFNIQLKTSFTDSETGSVIYVDIDDDYSVSDFMCSIVPTGSRHLSPLYVTTEQIIVNDVRVTCTTLQAVDAEVPTQPFISSWDSNQFNYGQHYSQDDINPIDPTPIHYKFPISHEEYVPCQINEDHADDFFRSQPDVEGEDADIPNDTLISRCRNYCDEDTDATTNLGYETG